MRRAASSLSLALSCAPQSSDVKDYNPVHTSNNVEATLSNATKSNVALTMLSFLATMSNEFFREISTKSKQIEHVQFVSTLSKESFDL